MLLRSRPRLHGDAASNDTSGRVGVGAGEVSGVDIRHTVELRALLHHLLNAVDGTLYLDDSPRLATNVEG